MCALTVHASKVNNSLSAHSFRSLYSSSSSAVHVIKKPEAFWGKLMYVQASLTVPVAVCGGASAGMNVTEMW